MKKVVIVSAVRTPIGSFMGALSSVPAPQLGAIAIKGALNKINLDPALVNEVYMGNVVQAGVGQAPARQAAIFAGLSNDVACTTINKVCASGMKSVMLGAQAIMCGDAEIVVAGGMENMSMIPHYVHLRNGVKFGPTSMLDGMQKDGLVDAYDQQAMGVFADLCATEYKISREDQDNFAIQSYERSSKAWDAGKFDNEIVPVTIPQRKGDPIVVCKDEEYTNVKLDRIPTLNAVFTKDGTVTAANASTINDGAAAMVLMSEEKALAMGLKPLAYIKGYADAAQEPKWFTTAPAKALPLALKKAGLSTSDVDFFEFNEAFSVVGLANAQILGLDNDKININGGAVSLGHPLGCSGARIIVTLINVLEQNNAKIGAAAICNGGGGASAIVIERA
ncbi:acetyl-CoA C-acyltransferase [Flavobacterium psychrophilum]|uniref:acetyl-CoA C-acetyltransferase n=1 Tax=Flavobacterium psychrophilum (strain ATCC 49511 / DSM 21280 / CIP 103535 / JIP02/86) TaxID=402612 RepID=A6GXQ0_FLAPJ|nr:acetyl-CoA C-acyltransferase [Flavobacterium psychrophilum]AIG29663.1 acetyl-CoA acetyltransferase [Flavobacterium psychrophilum]AIG31940.1 acetyl-CoA acetyltransferase [Flavobacterium psychrophilum]AIG34094.1 acetyl-CoA acetyltransferase [Flavobacterium psychrophilum]AIG36458.1 acetyl-CoA acetyltransferase [Flavobacterium psychrophilum]AIG38723.1 acetyl-CoA acetyltransferase [Flavobacterium psychrophilum]